MISVEDLLWFIDEALDGMVSIVTELGDELANASPDLPGASSPFAVLTHCLGVVEHWAGHVIAGREVVRDRDAEFVASGTVDDLLRRVELVRRQLDVDLAALDPAAPPLGVVKVEDAVLPLGRTQRGALLHIYEELAQHRGHMEVTRDVLLAEAH